MMSETREGVHKNKEKQPMELESNKMQHLTDLLEQMNQKFGRMEFEIEKLKTERASSSRKPSLGARFQPNPSFRPSIAPMYRVRRMPEFEEPEDEVEQYEEVEDYSPDRPRRRHGEDREREDNNMSAIKMKIPPFQGKSDPELYLEWERKIEYVFECHNYSELKKVRLAAIEFSDYALVWWDTLTLNRRRSGERPVSTWHDMKEIMRRRFVPNYYYRSLFQRLQNLTQGGRSVEDYFKELEMLMARADIQEDPEVTMSRFFGGLTREIADKIELYHCDDLEEMVHLAIKAERQVKRRGYTRPNPSSSSSQWKPSASSTKESSWFSSKPKAEVKAESTKPKPQGNPETSTTRSRD